MSRLAVLLVFVCASLAANGLVPDAAGPIIDAGWKSLAFRWLMSGDDNNNAVAKVAYRKSGASAWRNAMDARRVLGETTGFTLEATCGVSAPRRVGCGGVGARA